MFGVGMGVCLEYLISISRQPNLSPVTTKGSRMRFDAWRPARMLVWIVGVHMVTAAETTVPPDRVRENTPVVFALTNARIVISPGKVIDKGTLVVRDGIIVAAAAGIAVPKDATVRDLAGRTLYPGLIDAYSEAASAEPEKAKDAAGRGAARPVVSGTPQVAGGANYWSNQVTPQLRIDRTYAPDEEKNKQLRDQGITARLLAPSTGVVKGTSALVNTGDGRAGSAILRDRVALHAKFDVRFAWGEERAYPTSPMGAFTLFRQAFYDADWYKKAWETYRKNHALARPERNEALEMLQGYAGGGVPVIIDTPDELYFLRADQAGRELGLNVVVRGSGREYRRLDAVKATGRAVILPVVMPDTPKVKTPEEGMSVDLAELLHWDLFPENAGMLDKAGVRIAFSGHGLKSGATLLDSVRKFVDRGLSADAALRALTVTPAALFGVADRLGTLEPGKIANLVVADGDFFSKKTRILETWVDGERYETKAYYAEDIRGTWEARIDAPQPAVLELVLKGEPTKLSGKIGRDEKDVDLSTVTLDRAQLGLSFKGADLSLAGIVRMSATLSGGVLLGTGVVEDGATFAWTAARTAPFVPEPEKASPEAPSKSLYAANYPLGAHGVASLPVQPAAVLFRNATVWTSGSQRVIERGSVLVQRGKIVAVGRELAAPADAIVVDASGKHITAGLIDCHSHTASDGGINEVGQAITAEVRIGDFVDSNDISIYRELAGGLTTANVLHGSANPIGGQNQVIKLRWGALPEQMKFEGAPPGIKFALGENVKQSNWDQRTGRYPQTRMGVEQLIRDELRAALDYRKRWTDWRARGKGMPPRMDLELETIAEILEGKRLVHCHSYRQDEILALLRTFESFKVQLATLQHILEGYKVADAIAKHGAGASCFTDWWAYKLEVYDAIPYNGALMHDVGVVASFNSDSDELARRLNTEAAKAVKYGGLSEEEALKFVTLNPAKQLRIDTRVGSIEAGKDADLAIWNGPPLSTFSRCEQTWIDGRKYFDRGEDARQRVEAEKMRAALIQKVLKEGGSDEKKEKGEGKPDEHPRPPRTDIYCERHSGFEGGY